MGFQRAPCLRAPSPEMIVAQVVQREKHCRAGVRPQTGPGHRRAAGTPNGGRDPQGKDPYLVSKPVSSRRRRLRAKDQLKDLNRLPMTEADGDEILKSLSSSPREAVA